MEEDGEYFLAIFDYEREGLRHIGSRIISSLDWRSLVQLKRSCSSVHSFLRNQGSLEDEVLARKLHRDWAVGEPKVSELVLSPTAAVTNIRIIHDGRDLLVSVGKSVLLFPFSQLERGQDCERMTLPHTSTAVTHGLKLQLRLAGSSLNSKITDSFPGGAGNKAPSKTFSNVNENLEKNQITQFDLLNNCLIAGNNNGILSVWDFETTELLASKQLFGIITGLRCLPAEESIVTTHAGKAFDMGVVTVRKMVSPTELTVVWSVYQDVMPVFCFDVTAKWMVTLEWLGTFNLAHVGGASIYTRGEVYVRRDLSDSLAMETRQDSARTSYSLHAYTHTRFTAAAIFREDFLALASDDGHSLVTWDLASLAPLQVLAAHMSPVLQVRGQGDRLVSRDQAGSLVLWEAGLAADCSYLQGEECRVLLRRLDLGQQEGILGLDLDLRRLAVSRVGGASWLDFWDAASGDRRVSADTELSR